MAAAGRDANPVADDYGDLDEFDGGDSDRTGLLSERTVHYKREPDRVGRCNFWARVREICSGCTLAVLSIAVVLFVLIQQQPSFDLGPGAGRCLLDELLDCHGICAPKDWIADGFCDDPTDTIVLNCAAHRFDGGDCDPDRTCSPDEVLDCHNNCAPAGWSGDGVCDDPDTEYGAYYYNCAKLSFDGGDCVRDEHGCSAMEVLDCNGTCAPQNWLGDGYCDQDDDYHDLNCEATGFDGGDCLTSPDGCFQGYVLDCLGHCAPAGWVGDGQCDDESGEGVNGYDFDEYDVGGSRYDYVYNCSALGFDGGDCVRNATTGCYSDHVPDCSNRSEVCVPSSWVGDGECDDNFEGYQLNCSKTGFDGGDCLLG